MINLHKGDILRFKKTWYIVESPGHCNRCAFDRICFIRTKSLDTFRTYCDEVLSDRSISFTSI